MKIDILLLLLAIFGYNFIKSRKWIPVVSITCCGQLFYSFYYINLKNVFPNKQ